MLPTGVATSTPSAISSSSRTTSSTLMRIFAVWRRLAQQRHLVDGERAVLVARAVVRRHRQRMDADRPRRGEALGQALGRVAVHQEADAAAMHAVDRHAALAVAVQGLEHEAVAAQRDDDVGLARAATLAVALGELGERRLGLRRLAGEEGDAQVAGAVARRGRCGVGAHPPVTLMCRFTAGRLWRRSMMKSWPLGLRAIASWIAASSGASLAEARSGVRRSAASSWPEAHIERAGAGEPHAVAALAEIMGERRDEAEPPAGLAHGEIARRAAGAVVGLVERPAPLQPRPHQRQRQILVEPRLAADLAHRHDLDEDEVEALLAAPGDEMVELVVVDAFERDGVDLDREPGALARPRCRPAPCRACPSG